jgi:hypothetical protein
MRGEDTAARYAADHVEVTKQSAFVEPPDRAKVKKSGPVAAAAQAKRVTGSAV